MKNDLFLIQNQCNQVINSCVSYMRSETKKEEQSSVQDVAEQDFEDDVEEQDCTNSVSTVSKIIKSWFLSILNSFFVFSVFYRIFPEFFWKSEGFFEKINDFFLLNYISWDFDFLDLTVCCLVAAIFSIIAWVVLFIVLGMTLEKDAESTAGISGGISLFLFIFIFNWVLCTGLKIYSKVPYIFFVLLSSPVFFIVETIIQFKLSAKNSFKWFIESFVFFYIVFEIVNIIDYKALKAFPLIHKEWLGTLYNFAPWTIASLTLACGVLVLASIIRIFAGRNKKA